MRATGRGTKWTEEDLVLLMVAWSDDRDLLKICLRVKRTADGVCGKLRQIGVLHQDVKDYIYYRAKDGQFYAGRADIRRVNEFMTAVEPGAPWSEYFPKRTKEMMR